MAAAGVSAFDEFEFPFDDHNFTQPHPSHTPHDYHELQRPAEHDHKRIAAAASPAAFAYSPFFQAPFLPAPSTPHTRAPGGSPSLSSTVETLQSTPTHTPILRNYSRFEPRGPIDRGALTEPLRTKRKFPSLKQAKRLPRRADSGIGGGDSGLWEVYAAILAPPEQEEVQAEQVFEQSRQSRQQQAEGSSARSEFVQTRPNVTTEESEESLKSWKEREPLPASSYSLSKFEFPVPPGHDNWGGTFGHLTAPSSPQSPATLHLHGASFDLVNPHESLFLGRHEFETPAELDGLLDEYFDDLPEQNNMSNNKLPWSPSTQSLGAASDSSRTTRVLYDDAASARRYILHIEDDVPPPPKVVLNESPSAYRSVSSPLDGPRSAPLPSQPPQAKQNTSFLSNIPSINRVLGWQSDVAEQNDLGNLEAGASRQQETSQGASNSTLNGKRASRLMRAFSHRKGRRHVSDPFDLTLSDNGDDLRPRIVGGHPSSERRVERGPADQQKVEQSDLLAPDGADSQATSTEQDTDPTLKEILNGYDYTRVEPTSSPPDSDSSIEQGRNKIIEGENDAKGRSSSETVTPQPRAIEVGQKHDTGPAPAAPLPTPPAPTHSGRLRVYSGCSELPTSDQTYGSTHQLLQITPEPEIRYPPYRSHSPCHPATCVIPGHVHAQGAYAPPGKIMLKDFYEEEGSPASSAASKEKPRGRRGWFEAEQCGIYRPATSDEESPVRDYLDEDQNPGPLHGDVGLLKVRDGIIDRNLVRVSSIFTDDDESEWETEVAESQPVLQAGAHRISVISYADTSADGSKRLSVGTDALLEPPAAMISPASLRAPDRGWLQDRRLTFQLEDKRRDTQKAISLLSDRVIGQQVATKVCGSPEVEKEQRALDLMELERLRQRNPSAVREASDQIADKTGDYFAKMFKPGTTAKATDSQAPKINLRDSYLKGLRRKNKSPDDPASDRRALLALSPSPIDNSLQYDSSMNTFVTVRDQPQDFRTGKSWWPHGKDPTIHALKSPSPIATSGDISSSRRAAIDIDRSAGKLKRTSRLFSGQSKPVELKMLQPKKRDNREWQPLTDDELASRQPRWQTEANLEVGGALANYAMREEVRRQGPLVPHLPVYRLFPEDDTFDPTYGEEREIISKQVALKCLCFPPLALAFSLGAFDWVIERKTSGRIKKMAPKEKKHALLYHFGLGMLFWAVAITVTASLVMWFKGYGVQSGPNDSPFENSNR